MGNRVKSSKQPLIFNLISHELFILASAAMAPTFYIRPASLAARDNERLLAFFDSQLQWLETIGSHAQWRSSPRGDKEPFQKKFHSKIQRSEARIGKPYKSDWNRAYILEAEVDADSLSAELRQLSEPPNENGRARVPVAGMILESKSADYVRSVLPEKDDDDPFIFLDYLLSDRRTSSINKGAGAFLINHAKDEARQLGIRRITLDCWAGNHRKLVR